jgi:hypothetical protein
LIPAEHFRIVASAAARSALLLELVVGPEQQSIASLCRTTTSPVILASISVAEAASHPSALGSARSEGLPANSRDRARHRCRVPIHVVH